jgi:hypothetical protein
VAYTATGLPMQHAALPCTVSKADRSAFINPAPPPFNPRTQAAALHPGSSGRPTRAAHLNRAASSCRPPESCESLIFAADSFHTHQNLYLQDGRTATNSLHPDPTTPPNSLPEYKPDPLGRKVVAEAPSWQTATKAAKKNARRAASKRGGGQLWVGGRGGGGYLLGGEGVSGSEFEKVEEGEDSDGTKASSPSRSSGGRRVALGVAAPTSTRSPPHFGAGPTVHGSACLMVEDPRLRREYEAEDDGDE